jgi:hypothetical protein
MEPMLFLKNFLNTNKKEKKKKPKHHPAQS